MTTMNWNEKGLAVASRRRDEEFDGERGRYDEESFDQVVEDSLGHEAGTGSGSAPSSADEGAASARIGRGAGQQREERSQASTATTNHYG